MYLNSKKLKRSFSSVFVVWFTITIIFGGFFQSLISVKAADTTILVSDEKSSGTYSPQNLNATFGYGSDGQIQMSVKWSLPSKIDGADCYKTKSYLSIMLGTPLGISPVSGSKNCGFYVNAYFVDASGKDTGHTLVSNIPVNFNGQNSVTFAGGIQWNQKYHIIVDFRVGETAGGKDGRLEGYITSPADPVVVGKASGKCPVQFFSGSWDASVQDTGSGGTANFWWKYVPPSGCPAVDDVDFMLKDPGGNTHPFSANSTKGSITSAVKGTYTLITRDNAGTEIGKMTLDLPEIKAADPSKPNNGKPPSDSSDSSAGACDDTGIKFWHISTWNVGEAINHAVCEMQVTIISWEASILCQVVNSVLYPALGLVGDSSVCGA